MKIPKIFFSYWLQIAFVSLLVTFMIQSCTSDPMANDLVDITVKTEKGNLEVPELTKEDSLLIDSISKLSAFQEFAINYRQLVKKTRPVMRTLSEEELNRRDSLGYVALASKIKAQVDIENETKIFDKTCKPFFELIRNSRLSKSARIALTIKALQDSIQ